MIGSMALWAGVRFTDGGSTASRFGREITSEQLQLSHTKIQSLCRETCRFFRVQICLLAFLQTVGHPGTQYLFLEMKRG
jgi:hypothetical protein